MAGTTGLEPATSAVTVSVKLVTLSNQTARMAPFDALRHPWECLLCPYCARALLGRPLPIRGRGLGFFAPLPLDGRGLQLLFGDRLIFDLFRGKAEFLPFVRCNPNLCPDGVILCPDGRRAIRSRKPGRVLDIISLWERNIKS